MSRENEELVRRLMTEVWNERKFDAIDELCSETFVIHDPSAPLLPTGPDAAKLYIGAFIAAFPDAKVEIHDLFAAGDRVALRWSAAGTHRGELNGIPPTHRHVSFTGLAIYRLANGRIEEDWVSADMLGLLQQLGALPG
ncbi:MAG: ester cyclase [Gammaproteobacteria bacterium]|nr:ester cyclase [Gammaproteobacteria bacterium]MBI5614789.1 ester cyclase [Gammaproteobacteria bacterium]